MHFLKKNVKTLKCKFFLRKKRFGVFVQQIHIKIRIKIHKNIHKNIQEAQQSLFIVVKNLLVKLCAPK